MKLFWIVWVGMCLGQCLLAVEMRTWTCVDGRTVDGMMLAATPTHVKVQLKNGKIFDIPLEQISQADRDFAAGGEPEAEGSKTSGWLDDWEQAKEEAKTADQPILMLFTGSDWCSYCVILEKKILRKKEFTEFADEHIVLMKLDFPRRSKLPPRVRAQNEELARQFGVSGYPTLMLVNEQGGQRVRISHGAKDVDEFIESIERGIKRQ